jgi:signal recognition particle subunit SRP54
MTHPICAQIDNNLMAELANIKTAVRPSDTLLVVDAMTGQEAATLVKTFNDQVDITGEPCSSSSLVGSVTA